MPPPTHTHTERYIPYYISIRARNAAGYGSAGTAVAFTEEGSKALEWESPRILNVTTDISHISLYLCLLEILIIMVVVNA